ncbi:MAG: reverse transcriptase domain-containing protein [Caldilinea sp.]
MSKVYRHLFLRVCAWDNLMTAWRKACKGKRGQPPAATFELRAGEHLLEIQSELQAKSYRPDAYVSFYIHDPKHRLISAAPFRDRVVHHALCNVIEPLFERRFIHDSYANRPGKGTHAALDRSQRFARRYRYVLQGDVAQFFPAIDHALLLETLGRVVVDPDVLCLCAAILASGRDVLAGEYDLHYFPGDDLLAALRPRGLPIGNLTSQFWANVYLDRLDHFVKRELKCPAYLRYVDDFLLFADDKPTLWAWRRAIIDYLAGLRLTLHEARCHPQPVTEGIPFLGFVVYPDHRLLKRRKGIAYRRRLRVLVGDYRARRIPLARVTASVQGWVNHARYADTYGLRKALLRQALAK